MPEPLPADLPLTLYRGDTRVWVDTFRDAETGAPLDLSGHTFLAQIRAERDATEVMAVMTIDAGNAANGVLLRTLPATEARKLQGTAAYWDLQTTRADGFVRTYLAGKVRIKGDVSRGE
jgi:hypothetical protein